MSAVELQGRGEQPDVLDAFGRRDPHAVRAMYQRYGPLTYAIAHHLLGRQDLAEAAVRRTFIEAAGSAGRISRHGDPSKWMAELAYRAALAVRTGGGPRA